MRCQCHKSKRNRQIEVHHTLDDYKAGARELLTSEQGMKYRSNRPVEPETVFGQIKECEKFRRLHLKGLTGAKIEFGLKALAHNLRKLALAREKSSFVFLFLSQKSVRLHYKEPNLNNYTVNTTCEGNVA